MQTILTVMQVFLSLGLIGLILIQHGKGADAGAAFGSGASRPCSGLAGRDRS
jgi:preprotein translocase subunit SecG